MRSTQSIPVPLAKDVNIVKMSVTSPKLNRHNDPPENANTGTGSQIKVSCEEEDFCLADIALDEDASRGTSFEEVLAILDKLPDVEDNNPITEETKSFLSDIDNLRSSLNRIYTSLSYLFTQSDQIALDIAKALLAEHKSYVDSLTKQEVLQKRTNQLLSGVSFPPHKG